MCHHPPRYQGIFCSQPMTKLIFFTAQNSFWSWELNVVTSALLTSRRVFTPSYFVVNQPFFDKSMSSISKKTDEKKVKPLSFSLHERALFFSPRRERERERKERKRRQSPFQREAAVEACYYICCFERASKEGGETYLQRRAACYFHLNGAACHWRKRGFLTEKSV